MSADQFRGEPSDRLLSAIQKIARARIAVREHETIDRGYVEGQLAGASRELTEIIRLLEGAEPS